MKRGWITGVLVVVSCHATATRPIDGARESRLIARQGRLVVTAPPAGARRGSLFFVESGRTIPGSRSRMLVGLVAGTDRQGEDALLVTERCPVSADERPALARDGLAVVPPGEDEWPRLGACFAHYEVPPGRWTAGVRWIDLDLDVGAGDGVRVYDRYEVLGEAIPDRVNMTVTDFDVLGECAVQDGVTMAHARCRIDLVQHPRFDRDRALRGGYALRKQE